MLCAVIDAGVNSGEYLSREFNRRDGVLQSIDGACTMVGSKNNERWMEKLLQ